MRSYEILVKNTMICVKFLRFGVGKEVGCMVFVAVRRIFHKKVVHL